MEKYYFSSDTGQDETDRRSVWRIAISAVTLDKIKLSKIWHGELLFQL